MAKKPGTYSSKIIALKCNALGKYVVAQAWGYNGNDDYQVRHLELTDRPLMVSRTVKSARKLIDLIPAHLSEMISHADEHLRESIRDLEDEIRNNGRHLKYHEDRVARYRTKLDDLMTLASSKISIMEVTSEVSVSEQEIP